jgi:NAD+ kinase
MKRTVAIICKPGKPELHRISADLLQWFHKRNYNVIIDHESAAYIHDHEVVPRERMGERHPDFAVVLGGDGTLLSAARAVAHAGVPILGVNLGSLGFLTEVPLDEVYATLESIDRNECGVELRSMVHCELMRDDEKVASYDALNDAVINKSAIARLVSFDLYVNEAFVSNYKADGVIIATPTGSTAYSLAAGGPIIMPSADVMVITPVCVHSLTGRPLVVRDSAVIEIFVQNVDGDAFLTIDGQLGVPVTDNDRILCRRAEHKVKLLRTRKSFFEVLRTKLKWGQR